MPFRLNERPALAAARLPQPKGIRHGVFFAIRLKAYPIREAADFGDYFSSNRINLIIISILIEIHRALDWRVSAVDGGDIRPLVEFARS